MIKKPEQVISAGVLNSQLSSRLVRNATEQRLNHNVQRPNSASNIIAQGRVSRPVAVSSNKLTASVSDYSPAPGRNLARTMHLDIQNTPGSRVDSVSDAIQRYLNIRPRREATADPLDEASIARHPQQIIQSAQRWNDERYYQFAKNGQETYQFDSDHRTWAGRLELSLNSQGQAGLAATASRSPLVVSSGLGEYAVHDPASAAQSAAREMRAVVEAPKIERAKVGPPLLTENPYFDPAHAGQNTMRNIRQTLEAPKAERYRVGAPLITENPYFNPAYAGQNAMKDIRQALDVPQARRANIGPLNMADDPANNPAVAGQNTMKEIRQTLSRGGREAMKVGAIGYSEDPHNDPAYAGENVMGQMRAVLEAPKAERLKVGADNFSDDPHNDPPYAGENAMRDIRETMEIRRPEPQIYWALNQVDDALSQPDMTWKTVSQTTNGLIKTEGLRGGAFSADFRPLAYDQAYLRALRVIDDINKISPGAKAFSGQA